MPKRSGPKGRSRPAPQPARPQIPSELQVVVQQMRTLAEESPDGWGTMADILKGQPGLVPEEVVPVLARVLGRESLPLLRGMALDEDERLALIAVRTLPTLGTRAAGEALKEVYLAHPEGERAQLAWQGIQSLAGRGINISVPEPEGVRQEVPTFQLRETWESIPDGVGSYALVARGQDRYGAWHGIFIVWNDRAGVKDGFASAQSRQKWEDVREYQASRGVTILRVPADYARWHVARAREVNAQTGFELEEHLDVWDQLVGPPPEDYQPPDPTERVRNLGEAERADLEGHLECLLRGAAFRTWMFEPADVRPWHEEWKQLAEREGTGDTSEEDALYTRIANEIISPEVVNLHRARLIDVAIKLNWLENTHEADVAALAAVQMETGQPGEIAYFRNLVQRSLVALQEMLDDGEDPEALRYDPMQPVEEEDQEPEYGG